MIKAVVFDIGHVLVDWNIRYLYEKLIFNSARLNHFLDHVITPEWHFQHDMGRPSVDTIAELILEHPHEAELIKLYEPRWLETIGRPVPGVFEIIAELHNQSVPLYAITNFSGEFWPRFAAAFPVTQYFKDVVVSGDEKIMKPDQLIYVLAHKRFGTKPGDAMFIDDRLENVIAAEKSGFVGHHFEGAAKLLEHLDAVLPPHFSVQRLLLPHK